MKAGKLSKHITIEKPVETLDSLGAATTEWYPVSDRWASITPLSARETLLAQQANSVVTHNIRMRYTADIDTSYRLTWNDRTFHISTIINVDEKNRELLIQAEEKTKGG